MLKFLFESSFYELSSVLEMFLFAKHEVSSRQILKQLNHFPSLSSEFYFLNLHICWKSFLHYCISLQLDLCSPRPLWLHEDINRMFFDNDT